VALANLRYINALNNNNNNNKGAHVKPMSADTSVNVHSKMHHFGGKVTAAYRWVCDLRHLQADCQEPGSAPEPYAG